jgi:hypothetical protein
MTETILKSCGKLKTQLRIQILKKLYLKQNIYKGKQG